MRETFAGGIEEKSIGQQIAIFTTSSFCQQTKNKLTIYSIIMNR